MARLREEVEEVRAAGEAADTKAGEVAVMLDRKQVCRVQLVSFPHWDWVVVPKALRARRVNTQDEMQREREEMSRCDVRCVRCGGRVD
eukprot:COSAG01_NODE_10328_length_2192_cov_4.946011_2_plen_88_part_00